MNFDVMKMDIVLRTWQHAEELSAGPLTDQVTILNPVAASIGAMARQLFLYASFINDLSLTYNRLKRTAP